MALPVNSVVGAVKRVRIWYAILVLILVIFGVRLFYVQIIRYGHYREAALSDQLKQYQIPATRGIIYAQDGSSTVPIVLNQQLYTLYADPTYIKNPDKIAAFIAKTIGGDAATYSKELRIKDTRYSVLAKKVTASQKEALLAPSYPGLGAVEQDYRIYPQGDLASQVLGFVNDEGTGEYGIEQALNVDLAGKPGQLKAITDVHGVPLVANKGNISTPPTNGDNLTLTINIAMQKQLETILQQNISSNHAKWGSALIMDPHTGAVLAMGNAPTYDPSNYTAVTDSSLFNNDAVSQPIEVGSIMKTLTTSAALDQGVIQPNTTYYDPSRWTIDGYTITNIEEDGGAGTQSIASLLNLSLNTGATWELMQMSGGNNMITQKGRDIWHDYMVNHFRLGQTTGIEQGYEASGYVPSPDDNGAGIDLTYANTAFGQAMTATALQMGGALSSILNGGTYYQPHLIASVTSPSGTVTPTVPKILEKNVVSPKIGPELIPLMQYVVQQHNIKPAFDQTKYTVGGKTGTAQIAQPGGGYSNATYNGTYVGFVGGDAVQYVIVVFIDQPTVPAGGFAGTAAAQPVFAGLAHMLINDSYVTPKSK